MHKGLLSAAIALLLVFTACAQPSGKGLQYGKYGCTVSSYRNGFTQYSPRGYIVLDKKGSYQYLGYQKPSSGTFTVDAKGNLSFKGGYLDKGRAEKIDRPNKFFVTFPLNPDNRWTCGLVDK